MTKPALLACLALILYSLYLRRKYTRLHKRKEYYKRLSDLLEEKLVEP